MLLVPLLLGSLAPHAAACDSELLHRFVGPSAASRFGSAVAGRADLDGDDRPDVLVGAHAPGASGTGAGGVTAFAGDDGRVLFALEGDRAGDGFGSALAVAGDRDGDGRTEFLVGAPQAAGGLGTVGLHSGVDGARLWSVSGTRSGGRFGAAVAALGDVDGDGVADLVVGAPVDDSGALLGGAVAVLSGVDGATLWTVTGVFGDQLGTAVAAAGDQDGDGTDDVLVGVPFADARAFNAGGARVYSGRDGRVLAAMDGAEVGAQLGFHVAVVGDVDGDGRADFALGAPGRDANGIDSGAVELRSSRDGSLVRTIAGPSPAASLFAAGAAGDHDRDGFADVLVGAALHDGLGSQRGLVRVVSGRDGRILLEAVGTQDLGWFGATVAPAGDVDGDGREDLLVGAPASDDDRVQPGSAFVLRGGAVREGILRRVTVGAR